MKTHILTLALAVLVLSLCLPLRAADPPAAPPSEAVAPDPQKEAPPDLSQLPNMTPQPVLALVTCSNPCRDGQNPLSCTGTVCSAGANWVECDGQRQYCQCALAACTASYICQKPHICGGPWGFCYQGCCVCD